MRLISHLYGAISVFLLLLSLPVSSIRLPARSLSATPSTIPFNFTYMFTGQFNLGPPNKPIPISGGARVTIPILNGTISGPGLNATIESSLITTTVVNNGTIHQPIVNAVGTTSDGYALYVYQAGIGPPGGEVSQIQLEVGGGGSKYSSLQYGYILATIDQSANGSITTVTAYLVDNTD